MAWKKSCLMWALYDLCYDLFMKAATFTFLIYLSHTTETCETCLKLRFTACTVLFLCCFSATHHKYITLKRVVGGGQPHEVGKSWFKYPKERCRECVMNVKYCCFACVCEREFWQRCVVYRRDKTVLMRLWFPKRKLGLSLQFWENSQRFQK